MHHTRYDVESLESRTLLSVAIPNLRADLSLDGAWHFQKGDVAGASAVGFNDASWSSVNVPHTWNNLDGQDGGNNYYRGIGWYRRHYAVPASLAGKELFLQFDGSNSVTDVYVNGAFAGEHAGGFTTFRFDVTNLLRPGQDNVLAVKVSNAPNPNVPPLYADFTFDGGIYRNVHLIATDRVHVNLLDSGSAGVFLMPTKVSAASALLQITSEVRNDLASSDAITVRSLLLDAAGNVVTSAISSGIVQPGATMSLVQLQKIARPQLWNGRSDPYEYSVSIEVMDAAGIRDVVTQPVGFRFYSVDPNLGFFLNGHPYDLHGVDMHQDWINEGWAVSPAQRATDVALVEELGATVVRLSHYPYDQQIYDAFDRDGIVVWSEIPDVTYITPTAAFTADIEQQLREMILQNLNHPSVFFWGMFNELQPSRAADPNPLIGQLVALAHRLDPTRPTTAATNIAPGNPLNFHTDVIGFNVYSGWYSGTFGDFGRYIDSIHRTYPTRDIGLSEYGAGASIYQHTDQPMPPTIGHWPAEGHYHPEEYQDLFHEAYEAQIKARPWLWCKIVWNLIDYASDFRNDGDTPGRNDKGLVTYDRRTKKDAFYLYKANWSSAPVLHIADRRFTSRTYPLTQVKVYSNLGSARLLVNGVSQGTASASTTDVITWNNIHLAHGKNLIQVISRRNGAVYNDSCTWTVA